MKDYKNYYNGEFSEYDNTVPNYIIANQKYPTAVDDENISEETTYSSKKIEGLAGGVTPLIDKTSDTSDTFDIEPNKMYMFGERTTLTINLVPGKSGIVNEYMFQFTSGSVATTLNVPLTVTWLKDPDIQTNSIYQVSIENNLGIIGEWNNE
jgi:hypothetical protein